MPITDLLHPDRYVPEAERRRRLDICNTCPELTTYSKQCKKCGCFVRLKTKLFTEKCPLGKW